MRFTHRTQACKTSGYLPRPAEPCCDRMRDARVVGRTVSHYEILATLGEGGMGVVYHARDTRLGRSVALKMLHPARSADPERRRRFIQEAKAASALNHPNIVTIYDVGEEAGTDFIVMEHVAGTPLSVMIPPTGMRVSDALAIAIPVTDALARAHAAGSVSPIRPNDSADLLVSFSRALGPQGWFIASNRTPTTPGVLTFLRMPGGPRLQLALRDASGYGLSLSPNGRSLLYTKFVSSGADLVVVENFK